MKKVLVADDKATSRELIRTVLESSGYSVIEAKDGIEALQRATECGPDLIILDLQMPALDGFGVIAELRRNDRFASVPIMALTASAMPTDRQRAMTAGFDGYVSKPIPLSTLREEVDRLARKGETDPNRATRCHAGGSGSTE
jgi:CheY-like chemotaxis protein